MRSLAQLRPAELADALPIAALVGHPSITAVALTLERLLDRDDALLLVAEDRHDELAGFVHASLQLRLNSPGFARVEAMCLRENFRRNGLSGSFLHEVERWAARFGCGRICVETEASRSMTRLFFQRQGYRADQVRLVMDKPIGAAPLGGALLVS